MAFTAFQADKDQLRAKAPEQISAVVLSAVALRLGPRASLRRMKPSISGSQSPDNVPTTPSRIVGHPLVVLRKCPAITLGCDCYDRTRSDSIASWIRQLPFFSLQVALSTTCSMHKTSMWQLALSSLPSCISFRKRCSVPAATLCKDCW